MTDKNTAHKLYTEEKEQRPKRNSYVHKTLSISEERRDQLREVVEESIYIDSNIGESIQFLNNRSGWTPNETAYALFIFGYTVHGIHIMKDAMETLEVIFK